jgi:hypothetical protein
MDVNKFVIRQDGATNKVVNIPVQLNWDYLGLDMAIDEYEVDMITQVIGKGNDFEITRFPHAPETGTTDNTQVNYEFYFYSGGSMTDENNWRINYMSEGFTPQELFYYSNNFTNSFFKLDFYDTSDEKRQINYLTIILPTQQGLKMDALMQRTPVTIKKPDFVLDYVGDKEGFFVYWLKKRTFLDISTFYMSAKFYDAQTGQFVKMMNMPQSSISGDKYSFDSSQFFYYRVELDYEKHNYQVFNINDNQHIYDATYQRAGTLVPIKWYEYVNAI